MIYAEQTSLDDSRLKQMLADHQVRPTSQRVKIAAVLLAHAQHLSADQVLAKVNKNSAMVSKATVYNTLNLFAEKGLIRQVIIDSSRVFYDSNTAAHHHIYNEDTCQLIDIDASQIKIDNLPPIPLETYSTGIDVIIRVRNNAETK